MLSGWCQRPERHFGADREGPRRGGRPVALIVDAGPLYAYVDRDDRHHSASVELLETDDGPLVVPMLVINEVAYLVGSRLGADVQVRFLGDLAAGNLIPEPVAASDRLRIAELVARYRRLPLGPPTLRSWPLRNAWVLIGSRRSIVATSPSCSRPRGSRELRNNTRGLLDRVEAGEAITIDGRPVALLQPLGRRPVWLAREEFIRRVVQHQADAALADELAELAPGTTDDLPMR